MKAQAVVGGIGGILLVASSLAHTLLGLPPLRASLRQVGADRDLMETVTVGWLFGSVAMLSFGLILLIRSVRLTRGKTVESAPSLIIGICYVLFGLTAFLSTGLNPHFLGFILIGVLVAVSAVGRRTGEQ